jgi:hypothetical protein
MARMCGMLSAQCWGERIAPAACVDRERDGSTAAVVARQSHDGVVATLPPLAQVLATSRGLHERLLLNMAWLVATAAFGMMIIILIGMLMALPRLAHAFGGHMTARSAGARDVSSGLNEMLLDDRAA